MRIRTVKPDFFVHEGIFQAESETGLPLRVAYIGLWCAADREGRFKWEPRRLGVQILPYDNVDFSRVLDALVTRGFLVKYACQTGETTGVFGVIPSFARHQIINNKERASELPKPSTEADSNACLTREARVDDACHKEGKGKERNKEGKGTDGPNPTAAANLAEKIVRIYPRTGGNAYLAQQAVMAAIESGEDGRFIETCVGIHAERYAKLPASERQFCPGKERYFAEQRWKDNPDEAPWTHHPRTNGSTPNHADPSKLDLNRWNKTP